MKKARKGKSEFNRAFTDAEKKIRDEQVQVLAQEIRKVMLAGKSAQERILAAQAELRVLQQDLKDLRAGKLDKIRKRQAEAEGKKYSKVDIKVVEPILTSFQNRPLPLVNTLSLNHSPCYTTAGACNSVQPNSLIVDAFEFVSQSQPTQ